MKKAVLSQICLLIVAFCLPLFVSGCKNYNEEIRNARKNKAVQENISLRPENFPYSVGDVVLLKPDKVPAVVVEITDATEGCCEWPTGLYEIKYDSKGEEFTVVKFLKVTRFKCEVRYPITKTHTKTHILEPDEPTINLHYEQREINWYEIFGKADDPNFSS